MSSTSTTIECLGSNFAVRDLESLEILGYIEPRLAEGCYIATRRGVKLGKASSMDAAACLIEQAELTGCHV